MILRPLNYETQPAHEVQIRIMDPRGESTTVNLVVRVKDVNDAPHIVGHGSFAPEISVSESAQVGSTLFAIAIQDEDVGDMLSRK